MRRDYSENSWKLKVPLRCLSFFKYLAIMQSQKYKKYIAFHDI